MRNFFPLLLALLIALGTASVEAQSLRPLDRVKDARAEASFEMSLQPLRRYGGRASVPELDREMVDYSVLSLDESAMRDLIETAPDNLLLDLPSNDRSNMRLELVRVELFSDDFEVVTSSTERYTKVHTGLHYRGIVDGDESSLVALSFSDEEVMGLIATEGGNRVIGKLAGVGGDRHVIYNDRDLPAQDVGACSTPDTGLAYEREELDDVHFGGRDANNCVEVYFEVDNDVFKRKGGTNATTAYVTGLFNQVAVLYANENINIVLSGVYVWDTPDPYSGSSAGSVMNTFRQQRPNFNGNIAALLSLSVSGGIGYVDVLCSPSYGYSVSGIRDTYSNVPTYSWSVNVLAHEMGHNFGSQHTHACVWNGNATSIDGCYSPQGSCGSGPLPSGGGTIMSYCHLKQNVGIDFTKGFGDQPGALIRNRAYNGNCLSACSGSGGSGGGTTGSGGNGGDTGGGGSGGGDACVDVSVVIVTDNYPQETAWTLKTTSGSTVMRGSGYSARNASYTTDACLPAGCYNFVITDAYGDGICCSWGQGSFTVKTGSTVLTEGGQFGRSKTVQICLEGSGGDGGGGDDPNDGGGGDDETCEALSFTEYPPVAYGGTQDKGSVNLQDANSILLQNNAWKAILMNYSVTPNTVLEFEFGSQKQGEIHGIGFDNNNSISSSRTFQLFGTQSWGISNFRNYAGNEGYWKAYSIPVGQFYTGNFNRLFFTNDHDGGSRDANGLFRNIRIYENGACVAFIPGREEAIVLEEVAQTVPFVSETLTVYPNPVRDRLTAAFSLPEAGRAAIEVFNLQGQRVREEAYRMEAGPRQFEVDVNGLPAGTYLLRLTTQHGYQATGKFSVAR